MVTIGEGRGPQVFDQALNAELEELIRQAKEMAAVVDEASQLWDFERWLTQRRLEIERKYDYRYSVLPYVFATLIKQDRISKNDLDGLDLGKIEIILGIASR